MELSNQDKSNDDEWNRILSRISDNRITTTAIKSDWFLPLLTDKNDDEWAVILWRFSQFLVQVQEYENIWTSVDTCTIDEWEFLINTSNAKKIGLQKDPSGMRLPILWKKELNFGIPLTKKTWLDTKN